MEKIIFNGFALLISALFVKKIIYRLILSASKQPGLKGHSKIARLTSRLVPNIQLPTSDILTIDQPNNETLQIRKNGIAHFEQEQKRFKKTLSICNEAINHYGDASLTQRIQVPPIFRQICHILPPTPSIVKIENNTLIDADGNSFFDLSQSLSNNVMGYTNQYNDVKSAISESEPTLGILSNTSNDINNVIDQLKEFSKLDIVSFHMSGTEAIMQACRLARFHTKRQRIVQFCGAYHGWWDGVQPGLGGVRKNKDTLLLKQENNTALTTIRLRNDIAAVLVNPLHILFPNRPPPSDAALLGTRNQPTIDQSRIDDYSKWLTKLREICTKKKIALIYDEIYVGMRLGWHGAQEYFKVPADIVAYGKSFGSGLALGIVCSSTTFGQRFKSNRPLQLILARGTFQASPYVIKSIEKSLQRFKTLCNNGTFKTKQLLLRQTINEWNSHFNRNSIPLSITGLESIYTINFHQNTPFNWLFQYYCRIHGLYLNVTGTGRLVFDLEVTSIELNQILKKLTAAANDMSRFGWWNNSANYSKKILAIKMLKHWAISN